MDNVSHETTPQRSRQWYIDRMGIVTGSNMHRALMGPRGRATYIRELIKERELLEEGGQALDNYINSMMSVDAPPLAWGRKYEPYAKARLEMLLGVDIKESGFIVAHHNPNIGCSLDGSLVIRTALQIAEIKCPYNQSVHTTNYLLNGVDSYTPQIQGNIWVAGAMGCYFASFDPRASLELGFFMQYVRRDEKYLTHTLIPAVREILACVDSKTIPEKSDNIPTLF